MPLRRDTSESLSPVQRENLQGFFEKITDSKSSSRNKLGEGESKIQNNESSFKTKKVKEAGSIESIT